MTEKIKHLSIKHKFLFQIIAPIFTIIASICYNLRKDDFNKPNDIPIGFDYEISIQFIWVIVLIIAVVSYFMFYLGQKNTAEENSSLKTKIENLTTDIINVKDENLQLESEYESLRVNYSLFFDKMLSLISINLKLSGKDRISVYFIPKDEETFILLSRFSKNRTLNKKTNKNYPYKEGFIYKAIENGGLIENIDSDYTQLEEYIKEVKSKCTISRDRIIEMSMKSQSYYVKTIDDDTSETIGLIVLESLDVYRFNEDTHNETFDNYSIIIKEFISNHRNRFLSNLASNKGF